MLCKESFPGVLITLLHLASLALFVALHRNSIICIPNKPQDLEDGFTLHLVARRAAEGQPSSGTSEGSTHANGKSDLS
jgi:hypothetical protein